ncbi:hypothetical protein CEP52_013357 [Fusarium oligoseptatum]|uniref:Uncharacterized protein n=1 Tax=Fusarium oligoseptatum TaxID=2604345 RepID=A0A428SU84_9HYPO|nr:hypothetical protein CEP52_013357 [Fusarium oligoseptatum]
MLTLTSVETPTMDITVLDFESEGLGTRKVHSDTIVDLLEEPLPSDHRCFRWININHPSPDAISILREHTRLEGLGLEKELSKTQLPWDSNGYASVVLPLLYLDSSTNVPNEARNISSLQKEMIQECVYIISNSDSKVITIFDRPDHEDIISSDGLVAFGSDWPVGPLDTFLALKVSVTRSGDAFNRNSPSSFGPEFVGRLDAQLAFTREQALHGVTQACIVLSTA